MKKSVEILGLPVISITEGRELGMSKTLLVDAKNGTIAAITIEDEDWYRGVKLLPYSSVIAIGHDAVTVTNSENILTLEDAGDYEAMLDANIKIIGTKAITKSGTIQGKVVEIYIGETGKIEKVEIESADGSLSETSSEQISIFGKQVTVIDSDTIEKKTEPVAPKAEVKEAPKAEPAPEVKPEVKEEPKAEPAPEVKPEVKEEPKAEPAPEVKPEPAPAPKADNDIQQADKVTMDRQRRYLLGKKVTRQITNAEGVVLVEKGAVVTEAVLQKVQMANQSITLPPTVQ